MHGFDTADSHHAMHAFTWDPGGALHWQEGTFHYSPGRDAVRPAARATRRASSAGSRGPGSSTSSSRTGSPIPGATTSTPGARTSSPTPPAGPTTTARRSPGQVVYPAEARRDEAVLPDAVAAHLRLRAGLQPALPPRDPGGLPAEQRHRLPGHPPLSREGGRLGLQRDARSSRCCGRPTRTSARSPSSSAPTGPSTWSTGSTR